MEGLSEQEQRALRLLIERLVAGLRPEEIWLFGSRAEGRARPDSDYDLLAVVPDGTPEADLDPVSAWRLIYGLGIPADIIPCTRSEFEEEKHEIDTLARAAFLRGRRIYECAADSEPEQGGRERAVLLPSDEDGAPLAGSIIGQGDLISPIDEPWDAER